MRQRDLHTSGRPQDDVGVFPTEGDDGHPVPSLVRIHQETEDSPFDRAHPTLDTHGGGGVDDQDQEISGLLLAYRLPQILPPHQRLRRPGGDARRLRRRGHPQGRRTHGGAERDISDPASRMPGRRSYGRGQIRPWSCAR